MSATMAICEHRQGQHSLSVNRTTFQETLAQVGGTTSGWRRQKGPETTVGFVWSPQCLMYWWHCCQTMSPLGSNQILTRWVFRNSITRVCVYSGSLKFWKFIARSRCSFISPLEDVKELRKRIFLRLQQIEIHSFTSQTHRVYWFEGCVCSESVNRAEILRTHRPGYGSRSLPPLELSLRKSSVSLCST